MELFKNWSENQKTLFWVFTAFGVFHNLKYLAKGFIEFLATVIGSIIAIYLSILIYKKWKKK